MPSVGTRCLITRYHFTRTSLPDCLTQQNRYVLIAYGTHGLPYSARSTALPTTQVNSYPTNQPPAPRKGGFTKRRNVHERR